MPKVRVTNSGVAGACSTRKLRDRTLESDHMVFPSRPLLVVAMTTVLFATNSSQAAVTTPFDFSKHAIALNVTVKGVPLYVLLDTGVDPSVIDIKRADALALPVDRKTSGQADGEGTGSTTVFPATIKDLEIGGHAFGDVVTLAADMGTLSKTYGRPVDGVLGYSFLKDKVVLIDYTASTVTIFSGTKEAEVFVRQCRKHYGTPLRSFADEQIPVIPDFQLGDAKVPITLDTGSNRGIALYQVALNVKGIRGALKVTGKAHGAGARGTFTSDTATLNVPVGMGPFQLPAGEPVVVMSSRGSADSRIANIGNMTFAAMKVKLLLDYPAKQVSFYGDCAP